MSALPDRGSLREHPLPRILLALYRTRYSGGLDLARGQTHKRFVFKDGAPIASVDSLARSSSRYFARRRTARIP